MAEKVRVLSVRECNHLVAYGYWCLFSREDGRPMIFTQDDILKFVENHADKDDDTIMELIEHKFSHCPLCGKELLWAT